MAKAPRIRKSAPTVRERMEAAQSPIEKKPSLAKKSLSKIKPKRSLNLSQRQPVKAVTWPLRQLKRFLVWVMPKYLINSWRELKKVIWPSRKETWRLTAAVFIFAAVFGALVAIVDKGLDEIFKKVVLK